MLGGLGVRFGVCFAIALAINPKGIQFELAKTMMHIVVGFNEGAAREVRVFVMLIKIHYKERWFLGIGEQPVVAG